MEEISTISDASAKPNSTMLALIEVASICISFGTVMDGTVVSIIKTFWESVETLPDVSVAVHVTMVSPSGNT